MRYLTLSIVVPILLLIGGAVLHIHNLNKIYKKMILLVGPGVTKEILYKEMTIAQGSSFTALATASWIMLFVAFAYLYFLIPGALPYNYMTQVPEWASNPGGFFGFGILVAGVAAIVIFLGLDRLPDSHRNLKFSELYSFYSLSKKEKIYIGLTIPLLGISIFFSAWSGTIYPSHDLILESLSFIFLILPMGILIWPIWEGRE